MNSESRRGIAVSLAAGLALVLVVALARRPCVVIPATVMGIGVCGWAWGRAREAVLMIGTVMLFLVSTEAVLRLTTRVAPPDHGHDRLFQPDRTVGWRMVPDSVSAVWDPDYPGGTSLVTINSGGYRDVERPYADGGIVVLGDSFTTNLGVTDDEVFTRHLERLLGGGIAVYNYGVNGYGQVQQSILLDEILERTTPRLVLVNLYMRNDFDDNLGLWDWTRGWNRPRARIRADGTLEIVDPAPEDAPPIEDPSGYCAWIEDTRLIRLFRRATEGVPPDQQGPESRYCARPLGDLASNALELTVQLLSRMKQAAAAKGVPLVVVLSPSMWQVESARWTEFEKNHPRTLLIREEPQRTLLRRCADAHVDLRCFDLLPNLIAHAENGERLYYPLEQHWTTPGNRRVAEALARWLKSEFEVLREAQ